MKLRIDATVCMGHAQCEARSPELFHVADSGYNEMGEVEVAPGLEEAALRGAQACPERAISVLDDPSGEPRRG
ncbi:ferredoxin [Streptomyces sp. NPDC102467]|uniref:ferredoxin n=1 Tax=Streptomyces sp. NPDC102467 TaxID=3366179 RepID=UPI003825A3F6